MSLDIGLYEGDGDDAREVASLNWLRNPFGLCQWAEDNAEPGVDDSLWCACNHWNYDKSAEVNRPLFKAIVDAYAAKVAKLEVGHFYFDTLDGFYGLVAPERASNAEFMKQMGLLHTGMAAHLCLDSRLNVDDPLETPGAFSDEKGRLAIPQDEFSTYTKGRMYGSDMGLSYYKEWFGRLEAFADLLQDQSLRFYCSN
jgi:hypothetical protein